MVSIFHGFTSCKPYMSLKMKKGEKNEKKDI
jgi:hypothetical protein